MKTYEVEIKSLLGSKDNADRLKINLQRAYPGTKLIAQGKQLNHYFVIPKDLALLEERLTPLIPKEKIQEFKNVLEHGQKVSIRTRDANGKVILVIKASVGDDTSSNGVTRIEFEAVMGKGLEQLDRILLDSGCTYQAKWSREREEYSNADMHVCIDKNAGYGYLAEFEKVTTEEHKLEEVRKSLLQAMDTLGIEELPQERLERMFAHYNTHWGEYYGTDKTFTIE